MTTEPQTLKKELVGLFQYVQRVRQEIAAINRPADADHRFETMGEQLDAIVKATEEATNTIMENMEQSDELLTLLRGKMENDDQLKMIDRLLENNNAVFEACSFQDITGQRISKVVKSVIYVEDRVSALTEIWGKDELDKIEVKPDQEKTEDEKLMHGPQDPERAISQAEIDSLID
jgi:chemotaxis protein CheZ